MAAGTIRLADDGTQTVDQDDHGQARRTRWRRRTRARKIAYSLNQARQSDDTSPLRRLKSCGLARTAVTIRIHNGRAHATGLIACGNVWTCPTCSHRIRARRRLEIKAALDTHVAGNGAVGMMTLTIQHSADQSLAHNIDRLNHAWRRLQQRRLYRPMYLATTGTIATLEITTGSGNHGWHPHLHILLLAAPDTTEHQLRAAAATLRQAWSDLANDKTTPYSLEHGLNLVWFGTDTATAAGYVTEIDPVETDRFALELTSNTTKAGNDPFALLDNTEDPTLDAANRAKFIEYAYATKGLRAHRWSRGLRKALTLPPEKTDRELADENDLVGIEALTIEAALWNALSEPERLAWLEWCETAHELAHYFNTT